MTEKQRTKREYNLLKIKTFSVPIILLLLKFYGFELISNNNNILYGKIKVNEGTIG